MFSIVYLIIYSTWAVNEEGRLYFFLLFICVNQYNPNILGKNDFFYLFLSSLIHLFVLSSGRLRSREVLSLPFSYLQVYHKKHK